MEMFCNDFGACGATQFRLTGMQQSHYENLTHLSGDHNLFQLRVGQICRVILVVAGQTAKPPYDNNMSKGTIVNPGCIF